MSYKLKKKSNGYVLKRLKGSYKQLDHRFPGGSSVRWYAGVRCMNINNARGIA